MSEETSESGAPIYRHKPREEGWVPPNMEDSNMADIDKHVETHIGRISMVFHEVISDLVHIDVHQIPPTDDRPYWTLITSGMSDRPMTTPEGATEFAHAELMLCLPKSWKMEHEDWKDENHYWPIRWLKICARFPHEYKTWLSWGHTLPNGDPPEPFAKNTQFCCMMLGTSRTVSTDFWSLQIRPDKIIRFFALYPLYRGELEIKLKKGAEHMEELFDKNKITEIVNVARADLSAKPRWRIW
jgi:Suppressor of fused protein (SUFU).